MALVEWNLWSAFPSTGSFSATLGGVGQKEKTSEIQYYASRLVG
jgi:hypothetical protein